MGTASREHHLVLLSEKCDFYQLLTPLENCNFQLILFKNKTVKVKLKLLKKIMVFSRFITE